MTRILVFLGLSLAANAGHSTDSETLTACVRAVTDSDDTAPAPFVQFDHDFRIALERRDAAAIALLTQFPLSVNFPDDSVMSLADAGTLQKQFDHVFTSALRDDVRKQAMDDLICKYSDGIGYAHGSAWIQPAGTDGKQWRIAVVNVPGGKLSPPKRGAIDLACSTKRFRIVIDAAAKPNAWRYRVWNLPRGVTEKPDLELIGTRDIEGTSPCTHRIWRFKNKNAAYELSDPGCGQDEPPKNAVAELTVSINGESKLDSWCF
jgi:hypothetical protein